jgi:hypothetical protein
MYGVIVKSDATSIAYEAARLDRYPVVVAFYLSDDGRNDALTVCKGQDKVFR